jgi:tripartite-type tricarboxylate transporter receptor subunit TctC
VSSAQRIPALPDVPTVAESGFPGFEADRWYGLVTPAATPAAVVSRINAEVNRTLLQADVAEPFAREGAVAVPGTPQSFGDLIRREIPRWAEVVKAGNVKAD